MDLAKPAFSNPTHITNPLFPISDLSRVILLGQSDGAPLRVETTLLGTRNIVWNGRAVETLVSQYMAFLDGRIHEVAIDWYAQADDGAVWYFGEDVFNYEDGVVADTHGTWLAGRDGPAAMIMPGDPRVGNVWRPENVCGVVFEEVTATATGVTVQGPRGTVDGALSVTELHMDGNVEEKVFAPGYGEFSTGTPGSDLEAVALAVPTDALPAPPPPELETLATGALDVFDAAEAEDWSAVSAAVRSIKAAWNVFRTASVPPMLETQMRDALAALDAAVAQRDPAEVRQASIGVARSGLDFELRHRPRAEIDFRHIELWIRQLIVDAAAEDQAAVVGDIATLGWLRDRIANDALADLGGVDAELASLHAASDNRQSATVVAVAARLRAALAAVRDRRL